MPHVLCERRAGRALLSDVFPACVGRDARVVPSHGSGNSSRKSLQCFFIPAVLLSRFAVFGEVGSWAQACGSQHGRGELDPVGRRDGPHTGGSLGTGAASGLRAGFSAYTMLVRQPTVDTI